MTLLHFQPRRLQAAAERLIQAHPVSLRDLADPRRIQARFPNLLAELRARLMMTPLEQLDALLPQLTALERPLLSTLHLDPERPLRLKVLRLVNLDPTLADLPALLRAFQRFGPAIDEGPLLAARALEVAALDLGWKVLLRRCVTHPEEFPARFIADLNQLQEPLARTLKVLEIEPESSLGAALERGVLFLGPPAWALHGGEVALRAFRRSDLAGRLNAVLAAYNARRAGGAAEAASGRFIDSTLELINADADLKQRLRERYPEVWAWLQERRLQEFFSLEGGHHGKERFAFWRRYLGGVKDLHINARAGRLFMEFEGAGIVEFLQTGNATYVYLPDYFAQLRSKDAARPAEKHEAFKYKQRALDTWSHTSNWQDNFTSSLERLSIYPRR